MNYIWVSNWFRIYIATTWSKTDPQVLDSKYVYMYSLQVEGEKICLAGFLCYTCRKNDQKNSFVKGHDE